MAHLGLRRAAWALLIYNLFVIMFGAFVRATGSGAGCGSHWPLCNGQVIPRAPELETIIEFTHRATSGIVLLAVIWIVWAVCKRFPKGHETRTYAWASLWLTVVEALIGAGLVLYELVDQDKSHARLVSITLHLANTFLLLGALTLFIRSLYAPGWVTIKPRARAHWPWFSVGVLLLAAGVTGAIAALGNTLFPADSLAEGIRKDFLPESHLALRVRVLHPLFAVAAAVLIFAFGARRIAQGGSGAKAARILVGVTAINVAMGLANLLLLAPVPLQLLHLFVADLIWIAWVWIYADSTSARD